MLVILVAHIPGNPVAEAIPARFGFSDATEIFVFCSGVASALAFGRVFKTGGWLAGTARILRRVGLVYVAHLGVFLATIVVLAGADRLFEGRDYLRHDLNLSPLLDAPAGRAAEFLTLRYVPNYFDILPMYVGILLLLPMMMAAERFGRFAAGAFAIGLWAFAATGGLELPAETWSGRPWFFNPFSWQLLFFLGFGFGAGWLPSPGCNRLLVTAALAVLIAAAPFSCHFGWECYAGYGAAPWLGAVHDALAPLTDKTHLGPLRILHFLALAYLAHTAAGAGGMRLSGPLARILASVGRQTLAAFLAGLVLAQALGIALDLVGRSFATVALVNLGGCAALVLVAMLVARLKRVAGMPSTASPPAVIRAGASEGAAEACIRLAPRLTPAPVRGFSLSTDRP